MDIGVKHGGSFKSLERFLESYNRQNLLNILDRLALDGVYALASSTPIDSGITSDSWGYELITNKNSFGIQWINDSIDNGVPVVILIQYGHGTKSGGFVQGRDFINPAMQPIFDKISQTLWEEVTKL